jgi:crotonobetainyl-CoA:carnitine CoA-transferase CaiB-like acyl-CoA transferase
VSPDVSHRLRNELPLIRHDRFRERRADQGARRDVAVDLRVAEAELGEHLAIVLALKGGLTERIEFLDREAPGAAGQAVAAAVAHADVYSRLQAAVAILAASHRRETTGTGQYIDVAMAATLMAVNERANVDLNDADLGDEPAILGVTDCPFFLGPGGEHFTVATSFVGSLTFPSWLPAMRRADLADDPRFATAAARRANLAELHRIVRNWILTFADTGALDAQLDEAKIAFGEVRSQKQLSELEWARYWGAVQEVSDRQAVRCVVRPVLHRNGECCCG